MTAVIRRGWYLLPLMLVGCVLLTVGLVTQANAQAAILPPPETTIEVRASFTNLAETPGLGVAPDGSLGVVDRSAQRVIRLDPSGQVVAEWGLSSEEDSQAMDLGGLAA